MMSKDRSKQGEYIVLDVKVPRMLTRGRRAYLFLRKFDVGSLKLQCQRISFLEALADSNAGTERWELSILWID